MNKRITIKLLLITLFIGISSYYFYNKLWVSSNSLLYQYDIWSIIIVSISFGIISSVGIYNLSFYYYIRNLQYLYYGLAQLSTLIFLISLDSIYIHPFDELFHLSNPLIFYLSKLFILLFSMLFIREFIRPYLITRIYRYIHIVIYLTILDIIFTMIFSFAFLSVIIPIFIPIWFILSEAYHQIDTKIDKPFFFLVTGWYIVIFVAFFEQIGAYLNLVNPYGFDFIIHLIGGIDNSNISFPFMHISFAIESIFLSLAISYKFKLIEEKQRLQQSLLLQQSRLANMGEMLSIIAHQWREPLNLLSVINMNLRKIEQKDKKSMLIKESDKQIEYMSQTINSFRHFYNPSKNKNSFSVTKSIKNISQILSMTLEKNNIKLTINSIKDFNIYGSQNEFEQVILNIINNAKDALLQDKIDNPNIYIEIDKNLLFIKDNAKGISKDKINKIFEPYFSTKGSDGIGLYISKLIIEQEFKARLNVESSSNGTIFKMDNFL